MRRQVLRYPMVQFCIIHVFLDKASVADLQHGLFFGATVFGGNLYVCVQSVCCVFAPLHVADLSLCPPNKGIAQETELSFRGT